MAKLTEKLLFEIEYPTGTWNTIVPTNDDIVFSKKREKGQFFYRLELESELVLKNGAWNFISDIELTDHCANLPIRITAPLEGDITVYEGFVKLNAGDFDFYLCLSNIKPETDDEYTCLDNGIKKELNLFDNISVVDRIDLNLSIGTLEYAHCPGVDVYDNVVVTNPSVLPENTICLSELDGWVLLENKFRLIDPVGVTYPKDARYNTIWVRLTVDSATPPPEDGWVNIGGTTWVKEPEVTLDYDETTPGSIGATDDEYDLVYRLLYSDTPAIDNGMTLERVLELFMSVSGIDCDLTVVSNFFSINPDGIYPANSAYTQALEDLAAIVIYQKSDIKRHDAVQNATIARMKLEELFQWLAVMFKVFPSIEPGILRLEHVSYYEDKPISLDFTSATYARFWRGKYAYRYKNDESPRYDRYKWMDNDFVNPPFYSTGLIYGIDCASSPNEEKENFVSRVTTDLSKILNNPDQFSDDGFVFIAAVIFNGAYYAKQHEIINENGFGVGIPEYALNGALSFRNLLWIYHKWYAYQADVGLEIAPDFVVESIKPNKIGAPVDFDGWCIADFVNFDPATKVLSEIGEGEIEKITYSVKNGSVKVDTIYP